MIEELKKLVSIESVARPGEGRPALRGRACRRFGICAAACASFDFRTKNVDGLYGYAEIGEGEELIGILLSPGRGAGRGRLGLSAFAGTLAGDRLYGRGVIDDKGPAIASIFAMKELLASDQPLSKRIRIIFGQTEENGEWTDMESYKQQEELPSYGFTPDGDFPAIYGGKGYHAGDCRYGQNGQRILCHQRRQRSQHGAGQLRGLCGWSRF